MGKFIYWIGGYFVGVVVSYILLRKDFIEDVYDGDACCYLVRDRIYVIGLALLSWLAALIAICAIITRRIRNLAKDKKASW